MQAGLRGALFSHFAIFAAAFMLCAIVTIAGAAPSYAAEKLRFNKNIGVISQALINKHIQADQLSAPHIDIARADLNEDGLYEFIVKAQDCAPTPNTCAITILARQDTRMIELLSIKAKHIALGNDYNDGVRNVLAFKDAHNDFEYDVYVWEAEQSRYILSR